MSFSRFTTAKRSVPRCWHALPAGPASRQTISRSARSFSVGAHVTGLSLLSGSHVLLAEGVPKGLTEQGLGGLFGAARRESKDGLLGTSVCAAMPVHP